MNRRGEKVQRAAERSIEEAVMGFLRVFFFSATPLHGTERGKEDHLSEITRNRDSSAMGIGSREIASIQFISEAPVDVAMGVLRRHGLSALWRRCVRERGLWDLLPSALQKGLETDYRKAVGRAMVQEQALDQIAELFGRKRFDWLVFKGQHLAKAVYSEESLRTSVDIDLLVRNRDLNAVFKVLEESGFTLLPPTSSRTHERSLSGRGVTLDVHWGFARPGRSHIDLAEASLLSRKPMPNGWWVADNAETLTMLLVHPALTDYVTGRLNRAVDLHLWLKDQERHRGSQEKHNDSEIDPRGRGSEQSEDMTEALRLIDNAGLKTAAWATAWWTYHWLGGVHEHRIAQTTCPSRLMQRYLEFWLERDPARIYDRFPSVARAGFSLMLQENWSARFHAVVALLKKLGWEAFKPAR